MNKEMKVALIEAFQYWGCPGWFIGSLIGALLEGFTTFGIIWGSIPVVLFVVLEIVKRFIKNKGE